MAFPVFTHVMLCSSPVSVHVCHKSAFYRRDGPIDLVFGLQASFNQSRSISFTVLAPPSLTAVVYRSDRRDSMILLLRSVSDSWYLFLILKMPKTKWKSKSIGFTVLAVCDWNEFYTFLECLQTGLLLHMSLTGEITNDTMLCICITK